MGRDANGFADITRTSGSHKVGSVGILTNMAPANTMQLQRSLEVYRLRGHIHLLLVSSCIVLRFLHLNLMQPLILI